MSDQVISWPADIEPKIILKRQTVQLPFFGHLREDLLLDHAESLRDSIEYRQVEQIDTSVDLVADEVVGLLNEGVHSAGLIRDDDSESAWVFDCCKNDRALSAVLLVELFELLKRVVADDVAIEHEEQPLIVILSQDLLSKLQGSGSAKRFFLLRVGNLDIVLLFEWFKRVLDMKSLVIDSDDYLYNSNLGECLSEADITSI